METTLIREDTMYNTLLHVSCSFDVIAVDIVIGADCTSIATARCWEGHYEMYLLLCNLHLLFSCMHKQYLSPPIILL